MIPTVPDLPWMLRVLVPIFSQSLRGGVLETCEKMTRGPGGLLEPLASIPCQLLMEAKINRKYSHCVRDQMS